MAGEGILSFEREDEMFPLEKFYHVIWEFMNIRRDDMLWYKQVSYVIG